MVRAATPGRRTTAGSERVWASQTLSRARRPRRQLFGRMPVREAIRRLAQEDLVTIVPRKGTLIATIQVDDLQKIFELRLTLEALSARLAAERITDAELTGLESLIARARSVDAGSEEPVKIDRAFHLAIASATGNEFLHRAVERALNLALRVLYLSGSRMAKTGEIAHEYAAVLRALRDRDSERAAAAMQAHIEEFRKKVRGAL